MKGNPVDALGLCLIEIRSGMSLPDGRRGLRDPDGRIAVLQRVWTASGAVEPLQRSLAIFAARLLNERPPLIFEDGEQRRDFVYAGDVAEACRLALEVGERSAAPSTSAAASRSLSRKWPGYSPTHWRCRSSPRSPESAASAMSGIVSLTSAPRARCSVTSREHSSMLD